MQSRDGIGKKYIVIGSCIVLEIVYFGRGGSEVIVVVGFYFVYLEYIVRFYYDLVDIYKVK